jgi:hypothetical protein
MDSVGNHPERLSLTRHALPCYCSLWASTDTPDETTRNDLVPMAECPQGEGEPRTRGNTTHRHHTLSNVHWQQKRSTRTAAHYKGTTRYWSAASTSTGLCCQPLTHFPMQGTDMSKVHCLISATIEDLKSTVVRYPAIFGSLMPNRSC